MRYRHVEEALAKALGVPSDKMGAFRGRLRHLRNIGVPHLPKPGSGRQIEYTRESAIEMLIALELGALGLAPRFVARMLEHFRDRSGAWDCLMISYRPGDHSAVVRAGAYTLDGVQSVLEANYRVAIVNLAGSIAALDKSLCRQAA